MNATVKKASILHRYYIKTGFYTFLRKTSVKSILLISLFVAILLLLEFYLLDFNHLLNTLVSVHKPVNILAIFFISESFLGLVPAEIFIAWTAKMPMPWFYLFVLALLSYLGGWVSYLTGRLLLYIPKIKKTIEFKVAHSINHLRKWGGLLIIVGAIMPIPFTIVSMVCGMINYKFYYFVLWGLIRFLRFLIMGLIIFEVF